jgi:ADP-ribose pyrophosphatase YjhB (NUDIX family)
MNTCPCDLCKFNNPKGTATAVILRENKLLVLKRSQEPFKGMWDLPGGYMNAGETPEQTLKREMKEELGVEVRLTHIGDFPGTASYKDFKFSVLSHTFLADFDGEIKLDKNENSEYKWMALDEIKEVAFDSNAAILDFVKKKFKFDLARVRELTRQLDSSAEVKERSLYKAILDGFVATLYDGEQLVGMGWIFPRQTMLRSQAVVEDMIVDESQRGKGYGRKLLDECVKWARANGIEMIELTSNPKRIAANELYKKYGFQLHPTNHYLYKV